MKNILLKSTFILFFLISLPHLQSRWKVGVGLLGYSTILTPNDAHYGWNGNVEIGALFKEHFEVGVRFDASILGLNFFSPKFGNDLRIASLVNYSLMPYLRYYFLKKTEFRPYVLAGLGYSFSMGILYYDAIGPTQIVRDDKGLFGHNFATRIGAGIRFVRFLDFSVLYYYAGQAKINSTNFLREPVKQLQKKYQIHMIEAQLAFVFGGNLISEKELQEIKLIKEKQRKELEDFKKLQKSEEEKKKAAQIEKKEKIKTIKKQQKEELNQKIKAIKAEA